MRIILITLTVLWTSFWLFVGISTLLNTPDQIISDKEFIENEIKPSVVFVKTFKTTNGRLPTNREYYTWEREYYKDYSSDLTQKEDSLIPGQGRIQYIRKLTDMVSDDSEKFKDADWTNDFAIAVWRGEWMEYYFSWTDQYDTNNYSWTSGFISFFLYFGISIIPLFIWWLNYKKKNKQHITTAHSK